MFSSVSNCRVFMGMSPHYPFIVYGGRLLFQSTHSSGELISVSCIDSLHSAELVLNTKQCGSVTVSHQLMVNRVESMAFIVLFLYAQNH